MVPDTEMKATAKPDMETKATANPDMEIKATVKPDMEVKSMDPNTEIKAMVDTKIKVSITFTQFELFFGYFEGKFGYFWKLPLNYHFEDSNFAQG